MGKYKMQKLDTNGNGLKKCMKHILCSIVIYMEWYVFSEYYLQGEPFLKENVIGAFLLIAIVYILYRALLIQDKIILLSGGIAGILFGTAMAVGNKLYTGNLGDIFISVRSTVKYMVLLSGEILFWIQVYILLFEKILTYELKVYQYKQRGGRRKKGFWAGTWLMMALCYMPCYFSNYPGIMSYDSEWITRQALGMLPFDNFHPFLHTLIWTAFIKMEQWIGIPQLGLVSYSIMQVLTVTAVFTCVVRHMAQRGVNRGIVIVTWAFYALCPNIVVFSLITTKDVLFGAALIGFVLILLRLSEIYNLGGDNEQAIRSMMPVFCITGVLSCLLRNNMIYAMIISAVIILLVYKTLRKYLSIGFGIMIAAYIVIVGPVYHGILGVNPGDAREILSVPINQIARVYTLKENELPEGERQKIEKFMPRASDYRELIADPVKKYFNTAEFLNNKREFIELWVSLFCQYPFDYLEAFLTLNVPYWYPEADGVRSYIELGNYSPYYTFEYREWLPHVNQFYTKVAFNMSGENGSGIMRWPPFRQFFSLSMPFWMLIVMMISLIARKKGKSIIPFLPVIFLWLTYMLGPVSNFRYIYPIFILYPIIACYIAGGIPVKKSGQERK